MSAIAISTLVIGFLLCQVIIELQRVRKALSQAINDDSETTKELHNIYKQISTQNQILMKRFKEQSHGPETI